MDIVAAGYVHGDTTHAPVDQSDGLLQALAATSNIELPTDLQGVIAVDPGKVIASGRQNLIFNDGRHRPGPGYLQPGPRIVATHDIKTVDRDSVWVLDFSRVARCETDGLTVKIPNSYSTKGGFCPNHVGGVRFGASVKWDDLSVEGGSSCVGLGGLEPGGATGFDHSEWGSFYLNGGGIGMNFLPGSNTAGDDREHAGDISTSLAAIAMAQSASSGLVGCNFMGVGMYPPGFGVWRYPDGSGAAGGQFSSNDFGSFSAEFCVDAVFFDSCAWDAQGGVGIGDNNWHQGFYMCPRPSSGWGTNMSVVDYEPQTDGTVLVTVSCPIGFLFDDCGMWVDPVPDLGPLAIVGSSQIKRGSIQGSWLDHVTAANNAKSQFSNVTFSLTKGFATPPSTIHINMPKLGTMVARNASGDVIHNKLMRQPNAPGYPIYYITSSVHDIFMEDGQRAYVMAKVAPLFGAAGHVGAGCRWGVGAIAGISGQMQSGASCLAGHLLSNPVDGNMTLFDGSDEPCGVAILGAGSQQPVDCLGRVSDHHGVNVSLHNNSGADIPPFHMITGDEDNPGCVKATNDYRESIGKSGPSGIPNGGVGAVSKLTII